MRLSEAAVAALPAGVVRFGYDRAAVRTGVVHLGLGAFARAHQLPVFEDALDGGDGRWGVLGVSMRGPDVRARLAPQDHVYTLVTRAPDGDRVRLIGALRGVLVAPEDPAAVVAALAAPDVHLVTLTVTEKGYHLDPATGLLDRDDPDVRHDLVGLVRPRTAPGFVVAGLAARRSAGLAPFTVLSCDNLPRNGRLLEGAVLALAEAHDPGLARWIERNGAFPETMVDRIVPATAEADVAALASRIGVEDRATVKAEPFFQWVIEDRFAGARPDLRALGATLVNDVGPWEAAKLRLLNGAHSAMAYLGGLAGIGSVDAFVAHPGGRHLVTRLWHEVATTLDPAPGQDLSAYRARLLERFANPGLDHRLIQIAADGSRKLPQRLLAPMAERIAQGLPVATLALAVAGWMRWQRGVMDDGTPVAVDDPIAPATRDALRGATGPEGEVRALLELRTLFPASLVENAAAVDALVRAYLHLAERGAGAVLAGMAADRGDLR